MSIKELFKKRDDLLALQQQNFIKICELQDKLAKMEKSDKAGTIRYDNNLQIFKEIQDDIHRTQEEMDEVNDQIIKSLYGG